MIRIIAVVLDGINMVQDFLNELNALQDKYGIYIDADYEEDWEYSWDSMNCIGVDAYVIFVNKGGYEIQDIYKDKNSHYHLRLKG